MDTQEIDLIHQSETAYVDDSIKTLKWNEHIRRRPGMYVGKLGDGAAQDDGIYILVKEVIDNSIDEFTMGFGKLIELTIDNKENVMVRDYGRGIPLNKLKDCVSLMNTGGKYDSNVFKRSVGLNGVGTKAVNALSVNFVATSVRDGQSKTVRFSKGELIEDAPIQPTDEKNGTTICFTPDYELFGDFHFIEDYIEKLIWNYCYINTGLTISYNGIKHVSRNGLVDLLQHNVKEEDCIYPIVHFHDDEFEVAFTHSNSVYGEEYYSFANGQNTTHGGTHLTAFKEAFVKTVKDFFKKDFDPNDVRASLIAAISIKITEPQFEGQTKTKLGALLMEPDGRSLRTFILDFIRKNLDNYLHINKDVADLMQKKIQQSEKERKSINEIKKATRETAKKASLNNRKLRDCKIHLNSNNERKLESTLFITEGDSASGSITKSRNVYTQAVFSLRGKTTNSFKDPKEAMKNEELSLLSAALNVEQDIENLRYNYIVIATDADDDGMHIRLLMLTYFLVFHPELIKAGHVYILQTPLFRVRNLKETRYCYSEEERINAINSLGKNPEITRFKGLGEISPTEFSHFIGKGMRLDPVILDGNTNVQELLQFYMDDNKKVSGRREFIIKNLRHTEV